jgi:PAS domain S-box-containing protein
MTASILIVEDDRVVARDIAQQLVRIGHTVVGMTGQDAEAVRLASAARPSIVLMDIRLEDGIDGIEAAQKIREQCRIPVVFLTAYADDETVQRASVTEPFGYLIKPFEDSQLRTVIEMALYKHAAEAKLRDSERRYATTLSSIGDAVIATDVRARITFMNPVAETLTGWPQQEAMGRPLPEVFRIINEETRQTVEDPAGKVLRLGIQVGLANHTVLLKKGGGEVPIDDCGSPILNDEGAITGAVLVFRDLSPRQLAEAALRNAEAELARVSRLTTMGELAASIAHEMNQPLMAIVTNAEACLVWLTANDPHLGKAREAAERIIRDGHRAGDVIRSIHTLAKKSPPHMVDLSINDTIVDVLELIQAELRRQDVSLRTDLTRTEAKVCGDKVQLQQVILNLVKNAVEAMQTVSDRPRELRVSSQPQGTRHVLVCVEDNGTGLEAGKMDRVFTPFFTTKPDGVGVGLSICRSIVEAHGGRITASPRQPYGSSFQFSLPVVVKGDESVSS